MPARFPTQPVSAHVWQTWYPWCDAGLREPSVEATRDDWRTRFRGILADMLGMLGLRYGAQGSLDLTHRIMATVRHFRQLHGQHAQLPPYFVERSGVSAEDPLRMVATAQACVDNAVSKTVLLPAGASEHDVGLVLLRAWELGLKGCTVSCSQDSPPAPRPG